MADVEYEPRDVNVRSVVKAAVALGLMAAFGAAVSFGAYLALGSVHRRHDPKAAPLAPQQGRQPPMPRLQVAPTADLDQLRAEQTRQLTTYGWIDQQTGRVHIPIEEAMKLYVQRAPAPPAVPSGAAAQPGVPAEAAGPSGTATTPPVGSGAPAAPGATPSPAGGSVPR